MNFFSVSIAFVFSSIILINSLNLEEIRASYLNALNDKSVCKTMIIELANNQESNVHLAYYGAFQTIWANHVFNPFDKLSTFNKGKRNINKAAKLSPNNIEIVFIRYSIQKNCPGFLGYRSHIKQDREFLIQNVSTIASYNLKRMVESIIKK